MVKFRGNQGEIPIVGFGLSEDNVQRLKQGMPILVGVEDSEKLFGMKVNICIFYGKTEEAMAQELREVGLI